MRHLTISLLFCLALAGLGQGAKGWSVATLNGAPGLYRDGKPVAPVLFWQWEIEEQDAKAMSRDADRFAYPMEAFQTGVFLLD